MKLESLTKEELDYIIDLFIIDYYQSIITLDVLIESEYVSEETKQMYRDKKALIISINNKRSN